jgi:hypothetical protein
MRDIFILLIIPENYRVEWREDPDISPWIPPPAGGHPVSGSSGEVAQ